MLCTLDVVLLLQDCLLWCFCGADYCGVTVGLTTVMLCAVVLCAVVLLLCVCRATAVRYILRVLLM